MSQISREIFPRAISTPGYQSSYAELIAEFPELCEQISNLSAWRDEYQPDRHDRNYERQFPERKPYPFGNGISPASCTGANEPSSAPLVGFAKQPITYDPFDTTPPCPETPALVTTTYDGGASETVFTKTLDGGNA